VSSLEGQIAGLKAAHQAHLSLLAQSHDAATAAARARNEDELSALDQRHQVRGKGVGRGSLTSCVCSCLPNAQAEMAAARTAHASEVAALRSTHADALRTARSAHDDAMAALTQQHAEEVRRERDVAWN